MNVLRILGNLDPTVGGPPVSSVNSCIAAARAGAATTVLAPAWPDDESAAGAIRRLADAGIEIHTFTPAGWCGSAGMRWGISARLARALISTRDRFDIIHCHAAWQMGALVALAPRVARKGPAPTRILTPHESLTNFDVMQTPSQMMGPVKRLLKPVLINGFDRIVFSSALEARDSLPADGSKQGRGAVIHHPVFDETDFQVTPHSAPVRPSEFRVGYIGRLHPKKNIEALIAAIGALPDNIRLDVAGDGDAEYFDALRSLAERTGVADRITWRGFISVAEKPAYFQGIDLLAMPSHYECFGMAAAEAIIAGVPVTVAQETGVAEIVERHGCGTVTAPSAPAFAASITSFTTAPEKWREAANATRPASTAISFVTHGAALMKLYRSLRIAI